MANRKWYALYNERGLNLWGHPQIYYYSFNSKAERDAWVADDDGDNPKKMEVLAKELPRNEKIEAWSDEPADPEAAYLAEMEEADRWIARMQENERRI